MKIVMVSFSLREQMKYETGKSHRHLVKRSDTMYIVELNIKSRLSFRFPEHFVRPNQIILLYEVVVKAYKAF